MTVLRSRSTWERGPSVGGHCRGVMIAFEGCRSLRAHAEGQGALV